MSEEKLPVDETVKVLDYKLIYKTPKWWCAVVLANMYGHDKIMVYLWNSKDGGRTWKRKQKFGINFVKNWDDIKAAVDGFIPRLQVIK